MYFYYVSACVRQDPFCSAICNDVKVLSGPSKVKHGVVIEVGELGPQGVPGPAPLLVWKHEGGAGGGQVHNGNFWWPAQPKGGHSRVNDKRHRVGLARALARRRWDRFYAVLRAAVEFLRPLLTINTHTHTHTHTHRAIMIRHCALKKKLEMSGGGGRRLLSYCKTNI